MRSVLILFLAGAACGFPRPQHLGGGDDAGSNGTDAGDGGNDSSISPDDSGTGIPNPRGTVHVTVVDGSGAAVVGTTVVFADSFGMVIKSAMTDANGKADAEILPGASVTTVFPFYMKFQMSTTLALKPGDDLVLGPPPSYFNIVGSFTISWPDIAGHANSYWIYGPCGLAGSTFYDPAGQSPTAPTSFTFSSNNLCSVDHADFVVEARGQGGQTGRLLGFNYSANVPYVTNGSFAMADAWGAATFHASFTNVSGISMLGISRVLGGYSTGTTGAGTAPTTLQFDGPTASVPVRAASGFIKSSGATQTVRQTIAGSTTTYGLNVGTTLLAWLETPTFDAVTQQFRIGKSAASTTGSVAADLLEVEASWQRPGGTYSWQVFGPDADTATLPTLPAEISPGLNPAAGDVLEITATSYEADTFENYDSVRPHIRLAIPETFNASHSQAGLIRVSKSPPPPPPPPE